MHGHLSVAVPGSVAGLTLALERWGTLDLRDAVAPAARIARRGVPIDWYLAGVTAMYAEELARFPEAARTYLRDGRWPPRPAHLEGGDRVRYPASRGASSSSARKARASSTAGRSARPSRRRSGAAGASWIARTWRAIASG